MNDAEKYWRLGHQIVVQSLEKALEGKEPSPETLRDLDEFVSIVEEEFRAVRPRLKGLIKGNFYPWRGVDNVKIGCGWNLESLCAAIIQSGKKTIDWQPIRDWEKFCLEILTNKTLTDTQALEISRANLCGMLAITSQTLAYRIKSMGFPKPIRVEGCKQWFDVNAVDKWREARSPDS